MCIHTHTHTHTHTIWRNTIPIVRYIISIWANWVSFMQWKCQILRCKITVMRNKNHNVKYKVAITNNKATIMRHEVTITKEYIYIFFTLKQASIIKGTICDSFREVKQMFLLLLQNAKWLTFNCLCYSVIQRSHRSFVLMWFLDNWQVGGDVELDERKRIWVCVFGGRSVFLITRYVLYGWLKSQLHRGERV